MQVEPGDLILVRTPRRAYAWMRAVAAMPYDHIGVAVGGGRVLNVVRQGAVLTPVERMLEPVRAARILRPIFPTEPARAAFLRQLDAVAPCRYDALRGGTVVLLTAIKHRAGLQLPLGAALPNRARRHICSEVILDALAAHHPRFPSPSELALDRNRLGVASLDDFFTLAQRRPDVLRDLGAAKW